MIKIEHTDVYGFDSAIRGMRNPMNSWSKSDSLHCCETDSNCADCGYDNVNGIPCPFGNPVVVGKNDLDLMKRLSKAGNDHGKFLRMINVTCDITAPLYWWKEFDTYKIGTVANSCSTMHKIHAKEFTLDDFSHEHLKPTSIKMLEQIVEMLNDWREQYSVNSNIQKDYWWQMIQLLPSSYNQKRTVQLNYQVLKSMYFARRNHKLDEWHTLCEWMETLPYFKEIVLED